MTRQQQSQSAPTPDDDACFLVSQTEFSRALEVDDVSVFRRVTRSEGLQIIASQMGRTTGERMTLLDPNKTQKYTLQHMAKAAIASESKSIVDFLIRTLKTPINEYFEAP